MVTDVYVLVGDGPCQHSHTDEVAHGVLVDFDKQDNVHGVEVIGALSVEVDGKPVAAPDEGCFTDLTARLAAADQGWATQHGEPPSNPDYIRFLAQQVQAFEDAPVDADVVVLCGSMRYATHMLAVADEETAKGAIVLAPFCAVPSEGQDGDFKAMLDRLHRDKIRMANRVIVVSDQSGYYGESTRSEIDYAISLGLPVEYRCVDLPAAPADDEAATDLVARALYDAFHQQSSDLGEEPTPYEWVPWGESKSVTKFWYGVAHAAFAALRGKQP